MKRAGSFQGASNNKAGGGGGGHAGGGGAKKPRGEDDDDPSFEEIMMMEEEWLVDEIIEGGDGDENAVKESRWNRGEVTDYDPTTQPLGNELKEIEFFWFLFQQLFVSFSFHHPNILRINLI